MKEKGLVRSVPHVFEDCSDRGFVRRYDSHQLLPPSSSAIINSEVGGTRLRVFSNTLAEDKLDTGYFWTGIRSSLFLAAKIKNSFDIGSEPGHSFWVGGGGVKHTRTEDMPRTYGAARNSTQIAEVDDRFSRDERFGVESGREGVGWKGLSNVNSHDGLEFSSRESHV